MSRQDSDTREAALLLLSPSALEARRERVLRLQALVEAGLYRVDAGALARAIVRCGRSLRVHQASAAHSAHAGFLDTPMAA